MVISGWRCHLQETLGLSCGGITTEFQLAPQYSRRHHHKHHHHHGHHHRSRRSTVVISYYSFIHCAVGNVMKLAPGLMSFLFYFVFSLLLW